MGRVMREVWVHATGARAGEICNSTEISAELPGIGICIDHDRRVNRITLAPEAFKPGAYKEGTHRDDMLPADALSECYDLWASGAWPESNAGPNLDEVMDHLARLFGREGGA